jgi:hypothetical protein
MCDLIIVVDKIGFPLNLLRKFQPRLLDRGATIVRSSTSDRWYYQSRYGILLLFKEEGRILYKYNLLFNSKLLEGPSR